MKWSLRLGRWLGIDIYLHFTFILLLGFIGLSQWMASRDSAAAITAVLFFMALFGCVLLHEFGHALAARGYGIRTRDIVLLPIGGVARLERMPEKPLQELWVALAGPLVNVVIAAGLFIGLRLRGGWEFSLDTMTGSLAGRLLAVNVLLAVFNMLPAFPMDGGRVLRALLALKLSYPVATRVAASVGKVMAVIFGFIGLFGNPMLLLIALFVWIGASQEAAAAEMKHAAPAARVLDAMMTHYRTLAPHQTLADAGRHLLAGSQQDFPVVEEGRLVGMLFRKDLFKALQARGEHAPVSSVMSVGFPLVEADAPLEEALGELGSNSAPVFRNGEFIGLLTAENVGEFFMLRAALARRQGAPDEEPGVPPIISAWRRSPSSGGARV